MIFCKNIFYFFILLLPTALLHKKKLRIVRSGIAPASVCAVGLVFSTELDNTSNEDLHVELIADECCLDAENGEDCDTLQIIGDCVKVLPKETTKSFSLVAPLVDQFERKGFCTIHVDSRPVGTKRRITRDTVNILFDTRIKANGVIVEDITPCMNLDEDPLNDCRPVNCDTYYNGKKSFYNKLTKRCSEVPVCLNRKGRNTTAIYDPKDNRCIQKEILSDDDIQFIKKLLNKDRYTKDILIIKSISKPKTYSIFDTEFTTKPVSKIYTRNDTKTLFVATKSKEIYQTIAHYLYLNKYTLMVLGLVILVQCCFIIIMINCLANGADCKKKKVVQKLFNYRQDASVTTPLIGTSNIDTETTEFNYISESSNVDKKIKCYEACQRDNYGQMSMSDDILSKCLNRRDWSSNPKSHVIKETTVLADNTKIEKTESKKFICESEGTKDDERPLKNEEFHKDSLRDIKRERSSVHSEKEIKCHTYNFRESHVDFQDSSLKKIPSLSIEKAAQACFSNDSVEDFLSERGLTFLDENASRFSTTDSSPDKSSVSNMTSKTSKNNIIRNVLSYLSKSKLGTSSDPGLKARNKDLELIHISKASAYSSSSDLTNAKAVKAVMDSRSTF